MRIIGLYIFKWDEQRPVMLSKQVDLSSLYFYQRGVAKEHADFNARTVSSKIPPGNRASVALEEGKFICYAWTTQDGISATAFTDAEYPEKAAMTLLTKLIMDFREKYKNSGILESATTD